jgi:hypothetical protein
MDWVSGSIIAPAVAAGAGESDFKATTAEGVRGDAVERGTVQDEEGPDAGKKCRLGAEVTHPAQIAFTLFADIGDEDEATPAFSGVRQGAEGFREGEESGQSSTVVGNAGAAEVAVAIDPDVVFGARGEDGVEMGGDGDEGTGGVRFKGGYDVPGAIDGGMPAQGAEGGAEPLGALLFHKSRSGDTAELEMDVVDPVFLAGEPLEGFFDAGAASQIPGRRRHGKEVDRHF